MTELKRKVEMRRLMAVQANTDAEAQERGTWDGIEPVRRISSAISDLIELDLADVVPSEEQLAAIQREIDALPEAVRDRWMAGMDARPFLTPANAMDKGGEKRPIESYEDLLGQMDYLCRLVDWHCGKDERIWKLFHNCLDLGDDQLPTLDALLALKRAFYSLPEDEQRRILNGWRPRPVRESRRDLLAADAMSSTAYACVVMTIGKDELYRKDAQPSAAPSCMLSATTDDVEVIFKEGTSKAEALAALDRFKKMIAANWPGLIDGRFHSVAERKQAAVATAQASQFGDGELEAVGTTTA